MSPRTTATLEAQFSHDCSQCGAEPRIDDRDAVWGCNERIQMRFGCPHCGKVTVGVLVDGEAPPHVRDQMREIRNRYPAPVSLAAVGAMVDAHIGTGAYLISLDETSNQVRIVPKGEFTEGAQTALYNRLSSPQTLIDTGSEEVAVSPLAGYVVTDGGGGSPGRAGPTADAGPSAVETGSTAGPSLG
jgi:predicted RNA-binding Zn-ribbon protein involved in translation (DUF1610 family)